MPDGSADSASRNRCFDKGGDFWRIILKMKLLGWLVWTSVLAYKHAFHARPSTKGIVRSIFPDLAHVCKKGWIPRVCPCTPCKKDRELNSHEFQTTSIQSCERMYIFFCFKRGPNNEQRRLLTCYDIQLCIYMHLRGKKGSGLSSGFRLHTSATRKDRDQSCKEPKKGQPKNQSEKRHCPAVRSEAIRELKRWNASKRRVWRERWYSHQSLGGGNSNIFYFQPDPWENDPIWRAYFSIGWVQPPTRTALILFQLKPTGQTRSELFENGDRFPPTFQCPKTLNQNLQNFSSRWNNMLNSFSWTVMMVDDWYALKFVSFTSTTSIYVSCNAWGGKTFSKTRGGLTNMFFSNKNPRKFGLKLCNRFIHFLPLLVQGFVQWHPQLPLKRHWGLASPFV